MKFPPTGPVSAIAFLLWAYGAWQFKSRLWALESLAIPVAFSLALRFPAGRVRLPGLPWYALPAALGVLLTGWGLWQAWLLQDPGDVDFACHTSSLWNLSHGSYAMSIAGRHVFGIHSNYTLWLWVPVWKSSEAILGAAPALWIAPLILKAVQGILLTASACILTHPLRGRPGTANLAGAALVLSPPFAAKYLFGFHAEVLGAPVVAWLLVKAATVLAADRKQPASLSSLLPLGLAALFLCATKETFSLAIAGLALWGFCEQARRDRSHALGLFHPRTWPGILRKSPLLWALPLLAASFLLLYWFVLAPRFNSAQPMALAAYQPESPLHILSLWFRGETLRFFLFAAFPLLPILVRMPRRFLLLPLPWALFYASFPDGGYRELFRHYYFPLILIGYAALAFQPALFRQARWAGALLAASLLAFPLGKAAIPAPFPGSAAAEAQARKRADLAALFSQVPADKSLLCHGRFQYLCAARRDAENFLYRSQPPGHFDFVILDTTWREPWMDYLPALREKWAAERNRDPRAPPLARIAVRGSLELWSRRGSP